MTIARSLSAAALAALLPLHAAVALAQAGAPAPAPIASAAPTASVPLTGKPEKRALTPSELRDSATLPGDLRPERRVTPQVSIPLNKSTPSKAGLVSPPRATPPAPGGVDDAAARCSAMSDPQARDQCREKLGR